MKLKKFFKNHSISQIFFYAYLIFFIGNEVSRANPQLNHALAAGEADVASPDATQAFIYNPSSSSFNDTFTFEPLFFEHSYNRDGQNTLSRTDELSNMADNLAAKEVEGLVGKNLHFDTLFGFSLLSDQFTFASVLSVSYDSIIRGAGLPILELNVTETVQTFFSYSKYIGYGFSLGMSLKPTYRLEHHIEKATAEIAENKKIVNPNLHGNKGFGIGTDFGFSWFYDLNKLNYLMIGSAIYDTGSTNYNLVKYSDFAPAPTPMSASTGITIHRTSDENPVVDYIKLMYSYNYQEAVNGFKIPPHRLGVRIKLKFGFEALMGLYKGYPSGGIQIKFLNLVMNYISFFESSPNISYRSFDHRHGLSLHTVF